MDSVALRLMALKDAGVGPATEDTHDTHDSQWGKYEEEAILHLLLDAPHAAVEQLGHLKAEHFLRDECKYILSWIKHIHEKHGVVPTRRLLRETLVKELTVDMPHEGIMKIVDGKINPRDVPLVRDSLLEWMMLKQIGLLYESDTVAAYHKRDYQRIKDIIAGADTLSKLEQPTYGGMSYPQLAEAAEADDWLIEDVAISLQPLFIAGPKKALKTGVTLDMVVSLAAGTPFLGKFKVPRPRRVFYFSCECGGQDVLRRLTSIARARGVALPEGLKSATVSFELPRLADPTYMAGLAKFLKAGGYEVLIVDPLYLTLLNGSVKEVSTGNLLQMGPLFAGIVEPLKAANCTPVLCQHFKKSAPETLDLDNMTMSGSAEYARQSILMRRATPYTSPEANVLSMMMHGAGRGDMYRVMINEGKMMSGWGVAVEREAEATRAEERVRRTGKEQSMVGRLMDALRALEADGQAASKRAIREEMGVSGTVVSQALDLADDQVEEVKEGGRLLYRLRRRAT